MTKQTSELEQYIALFFAALDAQRQFDQAKAVVTQLQALAGNREATLWAHYFSGILAEEQARDWAEAERHYLDVLAQQPTPLLNAQVYLSLSIAYDKQGRWPESLRACQASIVKWRQVGDNVKLALALRQMAVVYCNSVDYGGYTTANLQKAKDLCLQALDCLSATKANPSQPFFVAVTWQVLGRAYCTNGEYGRAIACYTQYLQMAQKHSYDFHVGFAQWSLADSYHLSGEKAQALRYYTDALTYFQATDDHYNLFQVLARLGVLYKKLGQPTQALDAFGQSLTLLETVRSGVSTEAARSGFFSTVVSIYDNAILTFFEEQKNADAFHCVERARSRAFLDALVEGKLVFAGRLEAQTATLAQVQAALPHDTVLLEYYTTRVITTSAPTTTPVESIHNTLLAKPQTLLFAITHDAIEVYDLQLAPDLFLSNSEVAPLEDYISSEQIQRFLYDRLIEPVRHHCYQKRRLYIIPHGPLHYVPFHALLAPDGETLLRNDGPEIVYAPSATILFRELQRAESTPPGACLAIGYNGDAGTELRFAEEEALYIAEMAGGKALIGPTSKKATIYAQAPQYRALHFSCHGEFDPDEPLASLLHIGPGETLTGQEIIDHLQLNCNLVTLSACESGLSKVHRGDELYGLIRAFMYAGAPAILATLWRVDERTTFLFAEKFYQLVQQGVPYATAVKQAQLFLKTLTRKEAHTLLLQHVVHATDEGAARMPAPTVMEDYLKSVAGIRHTKWDNVGQGFDVVEDLLPAVDDDTCIFADPKFWAPFILIGDPQHYISGWTNT